MQKTLKNISFNQIDLYCILAINNLAREEQFLKLQKNLPKLKIFPAIIGKNLTKLQLKKYLKENVLDKMSISFSLVGEIGCFLSHLTVLKEFIKSKQEYCLVLEDDVALAKNFKNLTLEALNECPANFDLLYLYAILEQKQAVGVIDDKKYVLKGGKFWGTLAYLVSKKGATKVIKYSKPMRASPIDHHFIDMISLQKIKSFISKKDFVYNLGDDNISSKGSISSIIQSSEVIKYFFLWQFFLRFIYLFYFFLVCLPYRIIFFKWLPLQQYGIRKFRLWKLKKRC